MAGCALTVEQSLCYAGHSLGGALATLAAYDVRAVGLAMGKDPRVSCYTFGAPRTGNHSFARQAVKLWTGGKVCRMQHLLMDLLLRFAPQTRCCRVLCCCREYERICPDTWHIINGAPPPTPAPSPANCTLGTPPMQLL